MQFIWLLSQELQKEDHTVINYDGDKDTYIADATLDIIYDKHCHAITEDMDILILLV